jgi:hypothetical protein
MASGQLYALETALVVLETVSEGKLMAETLCKCFDLCEALLRHSYEHEHKPDICHALLSIVENSEQAYPAVIAKEAANALVTLCCGCTAEWKQEFLVRVREVLQQLPQELQSVLRIVIDDKQPQPATAAAAARRERSPALRTSHTKQQASPRDRSRARSRSRSRSRSRERAAGAVKQLKPSVKREPAPSAPAAPAAASAAKESTDAVKPKSASAVPVKPCTAAAAAAAVKAEPVTPAAVTTAAAVPKAAAPIKVRSKTAAAAVLKLDAVAAAAARVLAEAESCVSTVQEDNSMAVDQRVEQGRNAPAVSPVSETLRLETEQFAVTASASAGAAAAGAAAAGAAPPTCGRSSRLVRPVNSAPVLTAAAANSGLSHQVH